MSAIALYRALLRLLPGDLRERYGDDMSDMFAAQLALATGDGRVASFRTAITGIADLVRRIPYEHLRHLRRPAHRRRREDSSMTRLLDSLRLDVRFALRSLRRRPTFAIVAVTTLALSIGAATAIYSIVDGVLFRSLPYHDASRIVSIWQTDSLRKKQALLAANWDRVPLDYTDFLRWRDAQHSFDGVAVWSGFGAFVQGDAAPVQITGMRVSPGLFGLLGVAPILGRTFARGEDIVGGPRVTMLSYEAWQSRFGGRRDVLGSIVRFDDRPYEIIGVLPEGFTLERGKTGAPYWIPAGQSKGDIGLHNRSFHAIAKLKPGVTSEQAATETGRLLDGEDSPAAHGVRIEGFVRDETRTVRLPLLLLLGAVGILLAIACVNIATLLLGEASTREVEMSARIALGASRGRIIAQLLTESLLLAIVGGALGVVLAWWGTRGIVGLAPPKIPGLGAVHVDGRVLAAALVAATIAGLLFGLAPALLLSEHGPATLLRATRGSSGRGALQRFMIAAELALSVVLLVGAGLLSRSLQRLGAVDPGFRTDHLAVVRMSWSNPYGDTLRLRSFYDQMTQQLAALPGVTAVTAGSSIPFTAGSSSSPYLLVGEGVEDMASHKHEVQQRVIASSYFSVMGIPVLAGRAFSSDDRSGSELVAVISDAAAKRDFPGTSPIGQRVKYQGDWRTIVGVVRDTKVGQLSAEDLPSIYTPLSQRPSVLDLAVRTAGDPAALANTLRKTVQGSNRDIVVNDVQIMDDLVHRSFAEERFRTALIVLFGATAALLAAVGLFGVTARAVARRTREVGIRVALGATSESVVAMIVRQTMRAVGAGVIVGVIGALAASRILAPYLFGVRTNDPATYLGILALLGAASLTASWLPARRAGRVEPAVVLRDS
jgi:predicted permease